MSVPRTYEGACHCRAIGFAYTTALEPEEWQVRACQCSFCRIHGALSTSDPRGTLRFVEHVPNTMSRYEFGRKTADFLICTNCGAYIGAMMRSGRGSFGIINARALPKVLERLPAAQQMDYEVEAVADRTARREQRWTPIADG